MKKCIKNQEVEKDILRPEGLYCEQSDYSCVWGCEHIKYTTTASVTQVTPQFRPTVFASTEQRSTCTLSFLVQGPATN